MLEELESLERQYPEEAEQISQIQRLVDSLSNYPIEAFVEQVSAVQVDDKLRRLFVLDSGDLHSWTRHTSYSMRRRMQTLEPPIVRSLAAGELLASMVLLRSHLESAAMAAYGLKELTDGLRGGDLSKLRELIPKALFGSALRKHAAQTELIGDFLSHVEGQTIHVCRAIASLDEFLYLDRATGLIPIAYSLLCEFSHPNHRGSMHLLSHSELKEGWEIRYYDPPTLDAADVRQAIHILLTSMRGGYAASALLACWRFSETAQGTDSVRPSSADYKRVWQDLLQRPLDPNVA